MVPEKCSVPAKGYGWQENVSVVRKQKDWFSRNLNIATGWSSRNCGLHFPIAAEIHGFSWSDLLQYYVIFGGGTGLNSVNSCSIRVYAQSDAQFLDDQPVSNEVMGCICLVTRESVVGTSGSGWGLSLTFLSFSHLGRFPGIVEKSGVCRVRGYRNPCVLL